MNVKELIQQLKQMPDDMEVHFVYNYGDYWNTDVTAPVGSVDVESVTYSSYHQQDKLVVQGGRDRDDEDDDDEEDKNRLVVVLQAR